MERSEQRRIVEALVLASPEPLSAARIAEMIPYVKPAKAKDLGLVEQRVERLAHALRQGFALSSRGE